MTLLLVALPNLIRCPQSITRTVFLHAKPRGAACGLGPYNTLAITLQAGGREPTLADHAGGIQLPQRRPVVGRRRGKGQVCINTDAAGDVNPVGLDPQRLRCMPQPLRKQQLSALHQVNVEYNTPRLESLHHWGFILCAINHHQ